MGRVAADVLLARHRKFAALVARGDISHADAAKACGYSRKWASRHAWKLIKHPVVAAEIQRLQEETAALARVERVEIVEGLRDAIARAKADAEAQALRGKPAAQAIAAEVKAWELLSKVTGHLTPAGTTVNVGVGVNAEKERPVYMVLWEGEDGLLAPSQPCLPDPRPEPVEPWLTPIRQPRTVEAKIIQPEEDIDFDRF
ncbi:MAG: hypothetical protein AMXMBFR33_56200 [Candidatus Xenobia bacterium]